MATAELEQQAPGHDTRGAHHGDGHPENLAHHFDSMEQQFDAGKLGIWLFLVTEVLFFSGLFVAYALYRANHPEVFINAHHYLNTTLGAFNTVVLLISSLTMAWAVRCAQLNQKKLLIKLLAVTLACASLFLGVKAVEYSHKWGTGLLWAGAYSASSQHEAAAAEELPEADPSVAAAGVADAEPGSEETSETDPVVIAATPTQTHNEHAEGSAKATAATESPPHHDDAEHDHGEVHAAGATDHADDHHAAAVAHTGHHDDHSGHHDDHHEATQQALITLSVPAGFAAAICFVGVLITGVRKQIAARQFWTWLTVAALAYFVGVGVGQAVEAFSSHGPAEPIAQETLSEAELAEQTKFTGVFFSIYYAMTGVHAIHILAGMGVIAWLLWRSIRQDFNGDYYGPVDYVGLYWHLVDLVWIYLFPLLYLIR